MIFLRKEIPVVHMLKAIVRSVLMYGFEAWKLSKTEAKKWDAFQPGDPVPEQMCEARIKNKVAVNHFPPAKSRDHRSEQSK